MERLNHHHLYIFWVLAKQGTFTKAAEQLSIAQSAVTSQVKSLEDVLELKLVDRSNRRRPVLTTDGKRVLEYADTIFEVSSDLMKWAKRGEPAKTQVLRVGALSGLSRNLQFEFLKPILSDPQVKLEVTTGDQEKLVRLLQEHSLDIILSSHNVQPDSKASFYSHVLLSSPVVFAIHPDEKKRGGVALRDYLDTHVLYIPGTQFEARPELDAYLEQQKSKIRIAGEIDDIALLRIFALRSKQIVAIPEVGIRNELKELLLLGKAGQVQQRFYAITRQRKFPSDTIQKLISNIQK